MDIVFKKLKVENRFASSFENWEKNNSIIFSKQGFIDIYAPNGVGKTSFARALNNQNSAEYKYIYNGHVYTEKSAQSPVLVIDDFFFRNIVARDNEKLSDYILGSQISEELKLKGEMDESVEKVKNIMKDYLKSEYNLKAMNSCLCTYISNNSLKEFINSIVNSRKKEDIYSAEKLIDLNSEFILNDERKISDDKLIYIKNKIGEKS